jgi:glycosyltransferase involved in cell wall biosynthesis
MQIVGAMRVKNEARWIEQSIRSILPMCSRVHVFDDHSTDGTPAIAAAIPRVTVLGSLFTGTDEVRDKNELLKHVDALGGADWIIMIDGDEVLHEPESSLPNMVMMCGRYDAISFPVLYLWDRPDQVRVDGVYGDFQRESAFRYQGERFVRTSQGGNFHCGNVPPQIRRNRARVARLNVPLLHYGYMDRADRIRKYAWYNSLDPHNRIEDGYRHVVQGDVPEVPATAKLLHAGPLTLRTLSAGC